MTATGVNKSQMETAAKNAVAGHFDVPPETVTVTVTESRRLHGVAGRKLAGVFKVDYEILAPAEKVAAVEAKLTTARADPNVFKASMKTKLSTHLANAGVPSDVIANLEVTQASVPVATRPAAPATTPSSQSATGGGQEITSGVPRVALLLVSILCAFISMGM